MPATLTTTASRALLAGGGFQGPTGLAGLTLWLRTDQGLYQDSAFTTVASADADPVGGWRDLSGAGQNGTQTTAAKRPILKLGVLGGKNALRFDGVDDFLSGTGMATVANGKTAFLVFSPVSAAGTNARVFDSTTGRLLLNHLGSTANTTGWFDNATNRDTGAAATGAQVLGWSLTQPTGTMYRNGASIGTATYGGTTAGGSWFLCADQSGTTALAADVSEFLFYNRTLSTTERRSVESYLGARYGIVVV